MKANVEQLEGNKVKLLIDLEDAEVEKAVEQAFKKIAGQVNIPGFRLGKAPRKLVEARVGSEAARAQALNDALPDHYMEALRQTETDPIAAPEIEITAGETEGPVSFEAIVEVRPIPTLAGYEGLRVEVPNPEPSSDDIDAYVERMRAQYGELEPVGRPAQAGDFVTLDVTGEHDGEPVPGLTATDYSYEVGTGLQSLGSQFDSEVEGSSAGDIKKFTSPVPPDDREVDFSITIKVVNERKLPDLTDEWANEVSEFETVQALRADITTRLTEMRKQEATQAFRTGAIIAVAELVDDELPEALIDNEMQRQLQDVAGRLEQQGFTLSQYLEATGQDQEDFVAQLRSTSSDGVRADLALRALAAKEGLAASDEEVDAEVESLARQFGQKVAKVRRDLERADQLPAIRSDIRKTKAVRWLMDHVEVVDPEGKTVDRSLLATEDAPTHDHSGHDQSDHDHAGHESHP